jgi:RNA polymerase sigma-70 factor (ECF subfamily)
MNTETAPRNASWRTEARKVPWVEPRTFISTASASERASWTDARLIEAVQAEASDEAALDVLVGRYWDAVFARCQILTQNQDKAFDLAQETWYRLLRARHALRPEGNFPAYLSMIAMNLFRDSYRSSRRAGSMANDRLESLDASHPNDNGEGATLGEFVPDLKSLGSAEQTLLAIDIDRALEQLTPQLREVVVARFIDGESCAEIGRRHGRTEQTVSGWVREALRQMKSHLEERSPEGEGEESDAFSADSTWR